jgi:release factor glutamine methyltransferase
MKIHKAVYFPDPWEHNLIAKTVLEETRAADRVLDVGTGSGILAILAASKSVYVTAVDINPFAVKCARSNIELNNLSSRIRVIKSDLFKNVKEKFDLIIFNPPFRWFEPRDAWEKSVADKDYSTLKRFFQEARYYLKSDGRILVGFGTLGDIAYFKYLIQHYGYRRKQMMKESRAGWMYYTYLLTCR